MHRLLAPVLAFLVLATWAPVAGLAQEADPREAFQRLADEYLAFHFYFNPVDATALGIHDYDGRLPDLSQDGLFSLIAAYDQWLERVRSVDRGRLGGDAYWDHRILEHGIRDRILELEEVRRWERDPLFYVRIVRRGLEPLATGTFATEAGRMEAVMARERQIPQLLAQARTNLLNPSRLATELAVEATRRTVRLVRDELPRALDGVPPGEVRDRFQRINQQTIEELRSFAAWLEQDLLPRSGGDFRLGGELYRRKLLAREHLDVPVEDLLALARDEIERHRRWIESEARALDPSRTPDQVIRSVAGEAPDAAALLEPLRRRLIRARDFLVREDLLTLPDGPAPEVGTTPPSPAGTVAYLTASGPFEDEHALVPRLLLESPDPDWSPRERRTHLGRMAPPALLGIVLREAFPGRWVEALYLRRVPSRIRKVFHPPGLEGGWALYAEEMALDRGLGGGDPALRISQLRSALLGLARLQAGLRMHVDGASLDEAARIFREAAYMDPFPALREAQGVAMDPLRGADALGKMQISKLRADYQEHLSSQGETWVLANFHDRFLRIGAPVSMTRKILMPGDEAPDLPLVP